MDTREVRIGNRVIGGGNPVLIQSMTNTKTEDVQATVAQIKRLTAAGCEIIRCAVPTMEAAKAERERFEQQPSQSTAPAAHAPKVVGEQQYTQRTYTPTQDAMDAMMQEWEESHA